MQKGYTWEYTSFGLQMIAADGRTAFVEHMAIASNLADTLRNADAETTRYIIDHWAN